MRFSSGMVDVGGKKPTLRRAKAEALLRMSKDVIKLIKEKKVKKGDVFEQARVAGIMAAKKTHDLIPLCHPLSITNVSISFDTLKDRIKITSEVSAYERTGVEMEAILASCISAVTIYDMCKMYDRKIEISAIRLVKKEGGRSGKWER